LSRSRFTPHFLLCLCIGLFLAQWQGFSHGIHHAPESLKRLISKVETSDSHHSLVHDEQSGHHCAAYDSLTLSFALSLHPPALRMVDAKHAAIKRYQIYQISIEADAPFEARAPPAKHV
jgi:hypothetical protein